MDAREYFEQVRDTAARVRAIQRAINRIKNDESWRSSELIAVRGGSKSDPTATKAARHVEQIRRMVGELRELAPEIRQAKALCSGVCHALGDKFGYTLFYRYLHGMSWADVADTMGCSERMCYHRHGAALDYIDDVGFSRATSGVDRMG